MLMVILVMYTVTWRLCGKGGGWRRIASLNMTNPNEKCPTQFRLYSQGGVRACGRPVTSSGSCVGIYNISIKRHKVFTSVW